jgi:methionyl aminopeptidase
MFFTIEPMITLAHVKSCPTVDRGDARPFAVGAFEHSVGVTASGVEIFTLSQRHAEKPPVAA